MQIAKCPLSSSAGSVRSFVGHSGLLLSVDISHDMKHVLTASTDCTIRLWDSVKAVRALVLFYGIDGVLTLCRQSFHFVFFFQLSACLAVSLFGVPYTLFSCTACPYNPVYSVVLPTASHRIVHILPKPHSRARSRS